MIAYHSFLKDCKESIATYGVDRCKYEGNLSPYLIDELNEIKEGLNFLSYEPYFARTKKYFGCVKLDLSRLKVYPDVVQILDHETSISYTSWTTESSEGTVFNFDQYDHIPDCLKDFAEDTQILFKDVWKPISYHKSIEEIAKHYGALVVIGPISKDRIIEFV